MTGTYAHRKVCREEVNICVDVNIPELSFPVWLAGIQLPSCPLCNPQQGLPRIQQNESTSFLHILSLSFLRAVPRSDLEGS